jgi:hypothetical protein
MGLASAYISLSFKVFMAMSFCMYSRVVTPYSLVGACHRFEEHAASIFRDSIKGQKNMF